MSAWKNRIVGYGEESPEQLQANPWNWRVHTKEQQEALLAAIEEIGWAGPPVIVNRRTGHVVDGHLRVILAMRKGEKTVPVQYVDLSEEDERLLLATLDPISAMAAADRQVLADLLQQVETENEALAAVLEKIAEDAGVDDLIKPEDVPNFAPVSEDTQARLDKKKVKCPNCGVEFHV